MKRALFIFIVFSAFCFSCKEKNSGDHSETQVTQEADTLLNKYAKGFRIIEHSSYEQLEVLVDGKVFQSIFLASPDTTLDMGEDQVFYEPFYQVACLSTTHASMLSSINQLESLAAMGFADRVLDPKVLKRIKSSNIENLNPGDGDVDIELLASIEVDGFFVYPFDASSVEKYRELGVPCIHVAEYLEDHPLGRAEWIVFLARFFGIDADIIFEDIEKRYLQSKSLVEGMEELPEVFTGSYYQGNWFAPSGESFIAKLIEDAGAEYSFASFDIHENLQLEMEEFIEHAHDADFFGKVIFDEGNLDSGLDDLLENDERLKEFKSIQDSAYFYCNASHRDYFGLGVVEPHVILRDLIHVFHPELLPNYEYGYFHHWKDMSQE